MEETKTQEISNANGSVLVNDLSRSERMSNRNLDKYNQKEKLQKEEKSMEDSSAKLIAGNDQQTPASLKDFKIIKVIDKGSFGKVYLVVNKHTGQLFAMKRINKDILINKK